MHLLVTMIWFAVLTLIIVATFYGSFIAYCKFLLVSVEFMKIWDDTNNLLLLITKANN